MINRHPALRVFVLMLLFILASDFSSAQTAILSGKILDKEGKPIPFVSVSVPATGKTTVSKENGEYKIEIPSDTTVMVEFSHVSFGLRIKTVRARAGTILDADITVDATQTLDTVVIEDRVARSNFLQSIPTRNIHLQSSASGDFNAVIFTQPGVQQSNELSSAYSVRGGNFDENLVYVNDVEVYRPFLVHSGQQEGLSFVNSDLVSSISFSSGGFEARYGDKMASVLDIRYIKPREFAGSVSGGLLGASMHLQGASEDRRFTWLVGAREKSNSYLLKSLDTKGEYKPLFYDIQTNLTFSPTGAWEHAVLGSISRNKYRMIPTTRKSSFGTVNEALQLTVYFDGSEIDDYQTLMGAYTSTYRPYEKNLTIKFIASAFNTREQETFDILGQYRLDELENDLGSDNFGQSAFNIGTGGFLHHARNYLDATVINLEHKGVKEWKDKGSQLWWGIKAQREMIRDQLSEWMLVDSAGYSLPNPYDSAGYVDPWAQAYEELELYELLKSKNSLSSNRYSAYVQHAWSWETADTSEFLLTAGVRSQYWELNKQTLISPRITLAFKPNWKRDVLFKAASGIYYQPPFYREMRDLQGNLHTNLKAQRSLHFVGGTDINFKAWNRPFKYITELYYKKYDNLIPYEIDNVRIRYYAENNASGYAAGIDLKVNGEFVKGVDSWASLSVMRTAEDIQTDYYYLYLNSDGDTIIPGYTSNYIVTDSIQVEPGFIPRPMDQRVTFGLFFQDYLPKLPRCKMHLNLLFGSGLPFGPPGYERYKDILRMPPYRRVDIGFSYELIRQRKEDGQIDTMSVRKKMFKSIWISLEVFNLLAVNNVVSHTWVRDVSGRQYAVPNYLSNRLLNVRAIFRF